MKSPVFDSYLAAPAFSSYDVEVIQVISIPQGPGPLARRIITVFVFLLFALICLCVYVFIRVIPPISVRVVDAISGQPVAGVEVTLRGQADNAWETRTETKTTDSWGDVWFRPTYHWVGLLSGSEGYSITINEKSVASSPWLRDLNRGLDQTQSYFPMILQSSDKECQQIWSALTPPNPPCTHVGFPWFISVPLIPALNSPDSCKSISRSSVSRQCKELNTYRSAFLHLNSAEDVENDKAICRQLQEPAASVCLAVLRFYIENDITHPASKSPKMPTLPLLKMFPVGAVGDLAIIDRTIWGNNAYTRHVGYTANYGPGGHPPTAISIVVEDFPTEDAAWQRLIELPLGYDDRQEAVITDQLKSGRRFQLYHGPKHRAVFWLSGHKVIAITFYEPVSQQDAFVAKYLAELPSSL